MTMIDSDDDDDQRRGCAGCGQVGDSVCYVSKYGRGLICQCCNDAETNRMGYITWANGDNDDCTQL